MLRGERVKQLNKENLLSWKKKLKRLSYGETQRQHQKLEGIRWKTKQQREEEPYKKNKKW